MHAPGLGSPNGAVLHIRLIRSTVTTHSPHSDPPSGCNVYCACAAATHAPPDRARLRRRDGSGAPTLVGGVDAAGAVDAVQRMYPRESCGTVVLLLRVFTQCAFGRRSIVGAADRAPVVHQTREALDRGWPRASRAIALFRGRIEKGEPQPRSFHPPCRSERREPEPRDRPELAFAWQSMGGERLVAFIRPDALLLFCTSVQVSQPHYLGCCHSLEPPVSRDPMPLN